MRRDITNQHGYICPTENAAIWNADHPEKTRVRKTVTRVLTEEQIMRQGIQKPEGQKKLESFNAFLDERKEVPDQKVKKLRSLYVICQQVCSLAGVKMEALHLRYTDDDKVYTEGELHG